MVTGRHHYILKKLENQCNNSPILKLHQAWTVSETLKKTKIGRQWQSCIYLEQKLTGHVIVVSQILQKNNKFHGKDSELQKGVVLWVRMISPWQSCLLEDQKLQP